jgi:hypothetical protein
MAHNRTRTPPPSRQGVMGDTAGVCQKTPDFRSSASLSSEESRTGLVACAYQVIDGATRMPGNEWRFLPRRHRCDDYRIFSDVRPTEEVIRLLQ